MEMQWRLCYFLFHFSLLQDSTIDSFLSAEHQCAQPVVVGAISAKYELATTNCQHDKGKKIAIRDMKETLAGQLLAVVGMLLLLRSLYLDDMQQAHFLR